MKTESAPSPWFLLGLFVFALAVRLIYLLQFPDNPLFDNIPSAFDHYNFDISASRFAEGDLLARAPNNSYAPLYRYFLGVLYWVFGRNFYAIFFIQFCLGAGAAVLLYLIGKRLFDARAGLFAYLAFTFYTTEIIYEGIILRAAFIAFWGTLSFYLLLRLKDGFTPGKLAAATLSLSVFFQIRPNTLLVLPFIYYFLHRFIFVALDSKARIRSWILFNGVLYLSFIPFLVQCYLVHGKFVFFDASGPHTFISGNLIQYSGTGYDNDLTENYQKQNVLGYASNIKYLIGHVLENPVEFVLLYLRKVYFFFNGFEAPTNISVYIYREYSPWLGVLLNDYTVISALGLMGIVLAFRRKEQDYLLATFTLAMSVAVILFLNESRYRLPAVPFYILYAGYALSLFSRFAQKRRIRPTLSLALAFGVLYVCLSEVRGVQRIRPIDFNNLASTYLERDQLDLAQKALKRALVVEPNLPLTHFNIGLVHMMTQEWPLAVFHFEKAIQHPDYQEQARQSLLRSLVAQIDRDMGIEDCNKNIPILRKILYYDPEQIKFRTTLGLCLFKQGQWQEAIQQANRVLASQPGYPPGQNLLQLLKQFRPGGRPQP